MAPAPVELTLELEPRDRVDVIDVGARLRRELGDALDSYSRTLYCSYHTTAGYFEQSLATRLGNSRDRVKTFLNAFQGLFPPNADYEHDKIHKRRDLTDSEKKTEPRNADSHLKFIGSGLRNCVTYVNRENAPVYFVDLDGVHEHGTRKRRTTVMAFDRETPVDRVDLSVPVSSHPIDSVSLRDSRLGVFEQVAELVRRHGIHRGRVDITLDPSEKSVGLTVNEYETLLMQHDLAEVLRDPVRHAARKGRSLLRDPRAIPNKTLNYAQYDLVRVMNELMDTLRFSESVVEKLLAKFMAVPASRFLRLKRGVSLLVATPDGESDGAIIQGRYQSPILIQWHKAEEQRRSVTATLYRFE